MVKLNGLFKRRLVWDHYLYFGSFGIPWQRLLSLSRGCYQQQPGAQVLRRFLLGRPIS
jgi:hypothetical protein